MVLQASVIAVSSLINTLDLCLADGAQHGDFQCFKKTALAGAVGTVDKRDVMAEIKRFLPHESTEWPDIEVMESTQC